MEFDELKAIEIAEKGDAGVQNHLGDTYYLNLLPQNNHSAEKWYRLAAEQGHAAAQYNLAYLYDQGFGVPQNNRAVEKWSRLVAEQGDVATQNDEALKKYYTLVAEQGDAAAQNNLAAMYYLGHGIPKNYETAVEWFTLAAEQGHAAAQNNLALMYYDGHGVPKNYETAVEWSTLAAEQGHAVAQNNLGCFYEDGTGVAENHEKAFKWCTLSAEQGNSHGQDSLGSQYKRGIGVAQSDATALQWYILSAEQGNVDAHNNLRAMYADGKTAQEYYQYSMGHLLVDLAGLFDKNTTELVYEHSGLWVCANPFSKLNMHKGQETSTILTFTLSKKTDVQEGYNYATSTYTSFAQINIQATVGENKDEKIEILNAEIRDDGGAFGSITVGNHRGRIVIDKGEYFSDVGAFKTLAFSLAGDLEQPFLDTKEDEFAPQKSFAPWDHFTKNKICLGEVKITKESVPFHCSIAGSSYPSETSSLRDVIYDLADLFSCNTSKLVCGLSGGLNFYKDKVGLFEEKDTYSGDYPLITFSAFEEGMSKCSDHSYTMNTSVNIEIGYGTLYSLSLPDEEINAVFKASFNYKNKPHQVPQEALRQLVCSVSDAPERITCIDLNPSDYKCSSDKVRLMFVDLIITEKRLICAW